MNSVKITIKNYCLSFIILALIISACILSTAMLPLPAADGATSARLILRTTEQTYTTGDNLVVYGAGQPNDVMVVRLYDPGGRAIKIDNIHVDNEGFFKQTIFEWPEPSRNLPFGTYTVEAIPGQSGQAQQVQITFGETGKEGDGTTQQQAITHILTVKLDSPDQVAVGSKFRIFVQVTFDGVLVNADNSNDIVELLGSSHIQAGKENSTISLASKFVKLHEGIYYADVTIKEEGTYIVHAVAFNKGFLSHDSKVITISDSSLGTIQDTVDNLGKALNSTNKELSDLETGLNQTRSSLNDTKATITDSVNQAQTSIHKEIGTMEDASGQLNSIILPVLALISVIIALQISLFARIRSSYR